MKLDRQITLWGLALLLAAGCAARSATSPAGGRTSLAVRPAITAGGLRTQAVVVPYAATDVNHLQVELFKVSGGVETPVLDSVSGPSASPPGASARAGRSRSTANTPGAGSTPTSRHWRWP